MEVKFFIAARYAGFFPVMQIAPQKKPLAEPPTKPFDEFLQPFAPQK
jgi:hypothetical protein